MRRFLSVIIIILLVLCLFSKVISSFSQNKTAPVLNRADLPEFYFSDCWSSETSWGTLVLSSIEINGITLKSSLKKFVRIDESWYSEPLDIIKSGNIKTEEKLKEKGYQCITVRRFILPSKEDALDWLDIAFKCNYFTAFSGELFEERSYTGEKIGDKCFIFRTDKCYKDNPDVGSLSFDEFVNKYQRNDKTLYFVKNNVVVYLNSHYVHIKKEVPVCWIDNLAEIICSRL